MTTVAKTVCALSLCAMIASPAVAQDWSLEPGDYLKILSGFEPNPYAFDVSAKGGFKPKIKDRAGESCKGFVDEAPTVDIYFQNDETTSRTFAIEVASSVDTVLLITGPDGGWDCIDDANGRNPGLAYDNASTGLYSIWVGTYSKSNSAHRANMKVSY